MNGTIDKLSTEELQAELEKRQLEEMTKEQIIQELRSIKQSGSWADTRHQELLQLADRFGVDIKAFFGFGRFEFHLMVAAFALVSPCLIGIAFWLIFQEGKLGGGVTCLVMGLGFGYASISTWKKYRGVFTGVNKLI